MSSPVLTPLSTRSDNPSHRQARPTLAGSSTMTAVTSATVSEQTTEPRPGTFARLASLLVRIRSAAGEDLQATVARAIDEAFAGIHREMR